FQSIKMDITKDDFNNKIQGILKNARTIMEIAMDDSQLKWSDLDKIILVGGSTRVPAVQEMIKSVTGIAPSHDVNPDEAVAMGAACYAASLDPSTTATSDAPIITVSDVNSHSLGIILDDENHNSFNAIIIPRNTKIPTEWTYGVCTVYENQDSVLIQITEGEEEELEYVSIIGKAEVKLPPKPAGTDLNIIMSYDTNGIIQVLVELPETGENLGHMKIDRSSNLSDSEINSKINRLATIDLE
ncbi:MAG: Hsp70 family protein, partial [Eubacteriales bacterium]